MHGIVTVIGKDRVGIIASVCTMLAKYQVNILDISQTIMQGSFTMVMAVDLTAATMPIAELSEELGKLGTSMDISIRIQRQEIFDAMHQI